MARTKRTARITNSDGSSFQVPISKTFDQTPDVEMNQGGSAADSSEGGIKVVPSHFTVDMSTPSLVPSEGEEAGPSGRGEESDSSESDSDANSSGRLSPAPRRGEAMSKITASKTAAALLRASVMQQHSSADSPTKETPLTDTPRASSSQQPDSKVQKTTVGSSPGSARKQPAEKQPATPSQNPSRPPRTGPQEPDLVKVAKSMIKAVPPAERDAVRGVGTLDLDGITGLLAEAQATSTIRTELEAAKKKNDQMEATIQNLKDEMKPLKLKSIQYDDLEKSLERVKDRLEKQEKSLTEELSAKAKQEKKDLFRQCSETYNQEVLLAAAEDNALEEEEEPIVALVPIGADAPKKGVETSKKDAS
ncbi:hepatoma-derived growth factor-related protein 2-like [Chenopodium quinoa]|uniref:hepatoma-derived growth factor-related protein 2-like n=1 Tax=Chenopodium quinoa TaxID=63459 RepID=UPI000B776A7F|nr:hepatoma-derived growth factor-related protein 2-like [Chenopodium quinoa]